MTMDERTKELRRILLGQYICEADGSLTVLPTGIQNTLPRFQGLSAGWGAMHFGGMTHRSRSCTPSAGMTREKLESVLKALGRLVRLESEPQAQVCLFQYRMALPVLLVAEQSGRDITVTAYTARDALAWLRCRVALRRLCGALTKPSDEEKKQK